MRSARFVVRFDDVCPTMDWRIWTAIESHIIRTDVRPLLAVVPDNHDPKLKVNSPDPLFWHRVRDWQRRGWTIAVHGYQHRYVTESGGLLGLHAGSEFAGLPAAEQELKLRTALSIFERESIVPQAWVAPGHSFDRTTLEVLAALGLRVISDGFAVLPFTDNLGLTWIPQQLWSLRPRPFGVWTACFHPNEFQPDDLAAFAASLDRFQAQITSVPDVLHEFRGRRATTLDVVFGRLLLRYVLLRRHVRRFLPGDGSGSRVSSKRLP